MEKGVQYMRPPFDEDSETSYPLKIRSRVGSGWSYRIDPTNPYTDHRDRTSTYSRSRGSDYRRCTCVPPTSRCVLTDVHCVE